MLNIGSSTLSPSESQFDLSINSQYPYFDLLKVPQNNFPLGDYTTVDVGQAFNNNILIESPQESTALNSDLLTGETPTSVGFDPSVNGTETTREGLQVNPVTPIDSINKIRDLGIIHNQRTISDALWGFTNNDRYYLFQLDTPSSLSLNIDGAMKENVNIELAQYINQNGNSQGVLLRQGHNNSWHPENLNFFSLEPGSYWIRVSNKIQTSTFYNLTLTTAAPFIPPPDLVGNTLVQARDLGTLTPVNSPLNFSETVWVGDKSDYYRFNLDKPEDVHVLLSGLNGDADVQLIQDINSNGLVEQNENEIIRQSNTQLNQNGSLDFLGLDAGTYYLGISPRHQDTWYNLSLSATPSMGFNSNYGYGIANAAAAVAKATGLNIPFDVNTPVRNDNTWEQQILHVPEVWAQGITGQNIVVAVLDTGVDYNHFDLKDNIWTNSKEIPGNGIDDDGNGYPDDLIGWDFVNYDNNPVDEYLHGTHVAGIIAAENNGWGTTGVAYNAKIMPIRILDQNGNIHSVNDLVKGIQYAVDNGANIINMSIGHKSFSSPEVQNALQYAESKGVLCVMAAGNDNVQNGVDYPAAYADQWGIAVGAIDNNGMMTYFSNHAGSTPLNYVLAPGQNVDSTIPYVLAPGQNVDSTIPNNGFYHFNGTSMAAPYVAGIAALILSANPTLTPDQLKKIILQTTTPLPQTKIA
ncbi:MAG: hypothetical protein RLZZ338_1405 [Cyanobacteriota bacterium]|jgi:subtilisin family serine protease